MLISKKNVIYIWKLSFSLESEWDPDDTTAKPVWVTSHAQIPLPTIKSLNVLHGGTLKASRISPALQGTHKVLTLSQVW